MYRQDPGGDTRFYTLVTDDVTPATIVSEGHLVRVLRKAVQLGVNPITALQMATINAAQMLEATQWIGSLTPGRAADILVVDNLVQFSISQVFCDGCLVAENNSLVVPVPSLGSIETAAAGVQIVEQALARIGCPHHAFEMTLSLLGLVVPGELRLSNRGLVELKDGQPPRFVDLILDQ